MPRTRQKFRATRTIERPHLYKPNSTTNIIDEAFKKNIEELVKNKQPQQMKDKVDLLHCRTCRNANREGSKCYYAALHPTDKSFKSRKCIPAEQAILNCAGYQQRGN